MNIKPGHVMIAYGIASSLVGTAILVAIAGGVAECLIAQRLSCLERGDACSSWDFFWNGMIRGRPWKGIGDA